MSIIQAGYARQDASAIGRFFVGTPSSAIGRIPEEVTSRLEQLRERTPAFVRKPSLEDKPIQERLFDSLASFKMWTATVAMHIDRDWRDGLFRQLDSLLDFESWDSADPPPSIGSYATLLRMILMLSPKRRPGLGVSVNGSLIAMWTVGSERLTVDCLPKDLVRWHLNAFINGDEERAAGQTPLVRFREVLAPYQPARWL
jgi:hypothetical protein